MTRLSLFGFLILGLTLVPVTPAQMRRHQAMAASPLGNGGRATKSSGSAVSRQNSWKGITPLASSTADVARILSKPEDPLVPETSGPHRVEGGEVTFSFVTASLAKIYHAPASMVGRVFTVYFTPDPPLESAKDGFRPGFKKCVDPMDTRSYYYVSNDGGLAYQVRKASGQIESVIYQPLHEEIKRLRVNATCVF